MGMGKRGWVEKSESREGVRMIWGVGCGKRGGKIVFSKLLCTRGGTKAETERWLDVG